MNDATLAPLLGLLVAFLFAASAFLQQRAARSTAPERRTLLAGAYVLMAALVRNRTWLTGWAVNLAGFLTQALALHLGTVATVQPMLATQLLFALPMSALELRRWPRPRDWLGGAAICGGLVLLILVVGARPIAGEPDRARIMLAAVTVLVLIAVLMPAAVRLGSNAVVLVAGGCSGLCFAMTAVFIKLTTDDLVAHGVAYTARDWVGYALAASTLLGLVLGQGAFAYGPLPWVVAIKETVNPVAGYAIGVLAFPVVLPTDPGSLAGLAAAGLLVLVGARLLAGTPSARQWAHREDPNDPRSRDRRGSVC